MKIQVDWNFWDDNLDTMEKQPTNAVSVDPEI